MKNDVNVVLTNIARLCYKVSNVTVKHSTEFVIELNKSKVQTDILDTTSQI